MPAAAHAQVAVAPRAAAGQRPILDAARNGVPIVHIAPPTPGGVSRNQFDQFNVGSGGLILNNSSSNVQTQLGGWVGGNPQLGYVPARVIVNEVVGAGRSSLNGAVEVAGRKAEVVISNVNGLSCDGCSFINTGRATLTTGAPVYDTRGALSGVSVRQGVLDIGFNGLDAAGLERLDLYARGLVVDGGVWAKQLNAIAGANVMSYEVGDGPAAQITYVPQAGVGAAPKFAVDVTALGGMYPGAVRLIATEKGLGVNSTGRIASGAIHISADGHLTVGDMSSAGDIDVATSGNATSTGQVQSTGSTSIVAAGVVTNQGVIDSGGTLRVQGDVGLVNSGTIAGRSVTGGLAAGGSASTASATLSTGGVFANTGSIYGAGGLALTAQRFIDVGGSIQAAGDVSVAAQSASFDGSRVLSNGALGLTASAGSVVAAGSTFNATGHIALSASDQVALKSSSVQSQGDIALTGRSLANTDGSVLSIGRLTATTKGLLDNTGGSLLGGAGVDLTAGALINDASASGQALIASDHATRVSTGGIGESLSNRGGVVSAKTALDVQTGGAALSNAGGVLVSNGSLTVSAGAVDSTNGQIVANEADANSLSIAASSLINAGGKIDGQGVNVALGSGSLDNTGGLLRGSQSLTVAIGSIRNDRGVISSGSDLTLATPDAALSNVKGSIHAAGVLDVRSAALDNTGGLIGSGLALRVTTTDALANAGGELSASGNVLVDTGRSALNNASGRIIAENALTLRAGALTNAAAGQIASRGDAALLVDSLTNAGLLQAGNDLSIDAAGAVGAVANSGSIAAARDARLSAASISSVGSTSTSIGASSGASITAARDLSFSTAALANRQSSLQASRDLTVRANAVHNNDAGQLAAGRALSISGQSNGLGEAFGNAASVVDNTAGVLSAVGAVDVRAANLNNTRGQIVSNEALTLKAATVNGAGGVAGISESTRTAIDRLATVQAGGNLTLAAGRDLKASGVVLQAGEDLTATAARDITITSATGTYSIASKDTAGASFDGRAGSLIKSSTTQQASQLVAGGNLSITANTDPSQSSDGHGNLVITGTNIRAGDDVLLKGHNVSIAAAKASEGIDVQTVQKRSYDRELKSDETLVGGKVSAGGNLSVVATGNGVAGQGDVTFEGVKLTAQGQALVSANHDVKILDATTEHVTTSESHTQDKGLLKRTDTVQSSTTTATRSTGSSISAAVTANVDINVASAASANAATNNFLKHDEELLNIAAGKACKSGDANACALHDTLDKLSQSRQAGYQDSCINGTPQACRANVSTLTEAYADLKNFGQTVSRLISQSTDPDEVTLLKQIALLNANNTKQVGALIKTGLGELDANKGGLTFDEKNALAKINADTTGMDIAMAQLGSGYVSGGGSKTRVENEWQTTFGTSTTGTFNNTLPVARQTWFGIEVDPRLPAPVDGFDQYIPTKDNASSYLGVYSFYNGVVGEFMTANATAVSGKVVVMWGGRVGTKGNDIVAIDPITAMPEGIDNKYRSGASSIPDSPTYKNENTRAQAIAEMERVIRQASNISEELRARILANLEQGNFITRTVGSGQAKNTVETHYCNFKPC